MVFTGFLDSNTIIRKRLRRMEVEDEEETSAFIYDDFVNFVFQRDVCRTGVKPMIFIVELVHGFIEVVEVFVTKKVIVDNVPLASCVVEGVAVTLAGEIEPLRMAKLVALKVQVAFATEGVN